MNNIKRIFCVLLCVILLSSCAQREVEEVNAEPSVSIQTFGTLADTDPIQTEETISVPSFITTPSVTAPHTTSENDVTTVPVPDPEPSSVPVPLTEDKYDISPASGVMYATSSVNVREKPDADSNRVGHLDKNEAVNITGIVSNGWIRIEFKGGEYYVNGNYLSPSPGETTSTTTQATSTTPTATTTPAPATTVTTTSATTTAPPENVPDDDMNIFTRPNSYNALNYSTQKAVWFAYLDIDVMLKNATESGFKSSIGKAFDEVVSLGCNTVYVHVRSFGDAYYYSSYYPFTAAYADALGVAPGYDPLEIMIDEAHSRGLSFHAWINPMRTTTKSRYKEMPGDFALKQWYDSSTTNGTFMVYDSDTGYYWLSPAYAAVRQLICNGVAEIVSRYNVDAIHIDDYFYPTTSSSFDKAAFEVSGATDRAAWRRSVVNTLVKEIYSTVKACNSTVLFGVSPQGNIGNNRDLLYADVETWCSVPGYLDYVVPQIYYGFNDKLSFSAAAEQWSDLVTLSDVSLICGIAAYKVGVNTEWSSGDILTKQTNYISDMREYDGIAYYRHGSLYGSASSSEKLMRSELTGLTKAIAGF